MSDIIYECNYRSGNERSGIMSIEGVCRTLSATDYKQPCSVVLPCLTPDRDKRQNGRRFKDDGEPSFTLTAQDRHGVGVGVDTEDPKDESGMYVEITPGCIVYAVWYEKYNCYIAIRKLTPKECFRLQGWSDDYFEKAQFVNSDTQLFKQAGNGVTVDVVKAIAEKLT